MSAALQLVPDPEPEGLPKWQHEAACRHEDPELFFPARGDSEGIRRAKAICARCPVRARCLDEHLDEKYGIWGGMAESDRRAERRRRRPGSRRAPSGSKVAAILTALAAMGGTWNGTATDLVRSVLGPVSDPATTITQMRISGYVDVEYFQSRLIRSITINRLRPPGRRHPHRPWRCPVIEVRAVSSKPRRRSMVRPIFVWYDLWVGVFIDRPKRRVYIFPVPCFGIVIQLRPGRDAPLCEQDLLGGAQDLPDGGPGGAAHKEHYVRQDGQEGRP